MAVVSQVSSSRLKVSPTVICVSTSAAFARLKVTVLEEVDSVSLLSRSCHTMAPPVLSVSQEKIKKSVPSCTMWRFRYFSSSSSTLSCCHTSSSPSPRKRSSLMERSLKTLHW